jgi:hypothetical protein
MITGIGTPSSQSSIAGILTSLKINSKASQNSARLPDDSRQPADHEMLVIRDLCRAAAPGEP